MLVNFVISKNLNSKIFFDIFRRYVDYDARRMSVIVSEHPIKDADIYHYHRAHLETKLARPSIVTVHHDLRDIDPYFKPEVFFQIYKQVDTIICINSLQAKDLMMQGFENTVVIPHGYDRNIFKKKLKSFHADRKIKLGIISRHYDRRVKGEAYIYELACRLPSQRFAFVLVGQGRTEEAFHLREMGFEVEVFEYLPYRLYGQIYDQIDFLLMVSCFEGGPANLPEALASGCPVLCTPVGMVKDLVVDEINGVILSEDIYQDMPAFEKIMNNEAGFTDQLYSGAYELNTVIPWEDVIERHIEVYRKTANL